MKWTRRIMCAVAVAVLAGVLGFQAGAQSTRTLEVNQVARVGESIVTAEQFIQRLVEYESPKPHEERVHARVGGLIVAERLLELEAERLEVRVRPRELGNEMEAIEGRLREEYRAYREALQQEARKRGLDDYDFTWRDFLGRRGITEAQLQNMIRGIARERILKRLIVGYWERSTEHATAHGIRLTTRRQAEEIRSRLVRGERIDVVAPRYSNERRTRENMGLIGTVWPNDNRLDPAVDEIFWKLEDGEISQPVRTESGWWVVRRTQSFLPNEANIWDMHEELMSGPDVTENRFLAWQYALVRSDRYRYEQRMPGIDCEADQE
jgi:hypothetical protein